MKKAEYDFIVEYAKSDRSVCKTSKEKIEKGEMRIGKMIQSTKFDGKIPEWHHWKHFFAKNNKGLTKWEMLHGREKLRLPDQEKIKAMIEKHAGGDKGGTKRKANDDGDNASKKQKVETPEEKAIREENELMWQIRDALDDFKPKELKEILELNGQSEKGGKDDLLDRVVAGMMFGALPAGCPDKECKNGHLYFDKVNGKYKCTGQPNAWAKCLWEGDPDEVKTEPWEIPDWARENVKYLKKWKFVKRKRAIAKQEIVRAEITDERHAIMSGREEEVKAARLKRNFFNIGKKMEKPFEGMTIAFVGKLGSTQSQLKKSVEKLGGKVSSSVTPKVTHVIAEKKAVAAEGKKIQDAIKYDIPILNEDWLDETSERGEFLNQVDYLIGGSEEAQTKLKIDFTDPKEDEKKEQTQAATEKKVKLVMKGRAAVDPAAGQKIVDNYHVLDNGGTELYTVVLNLTDIITNTNSYYALQLLEHDKLKNDYQLFRKWGRVGTKIGGTKVQDFDDKDTAIEEFAVVYEDKTGNSWDNRDKFQKVSGKFFPIDSAMMITRMIH